MIISFFFLGGEGIIRVDNGSTSGVLGAATWKKPTVPSEKK